MLRTVSCHTVLAVVSVLIWDPVALGQPRDAASVLTAAREALGGEKSLAAVRTFVATGRTRQLRGDNLVPIEFEIACELPDKYVRRDEFPAQDIPPAVNGFRGDDAIGPSRTTREEFARLMLAAFAASFPPLPLTFKYSAEAEAPQGTADVLEVAGPANFSARFVVQRDTHLPVMLMWQAPGPPGRGGPGPGGPRAGGPGAAPSAEHRLYYADYRAVSGGVKWPFRIRHAVAGTTIEETTFDRVTVNTTIDRKKFETLK
jgi:hypothetical protein